jgi:hypothetical protein
MTVYTEEQLINQTIQLDHEIKLFGMSEELVVKDKEIKDRWLAYLEHIFPEWKYRGDNQRKLKDISKYLDSIGKKIEFLTK